MNLQYMFLLAVSVSSFSPVVSAADDGINTPTASNKDDGWLAKVRHSLRSSTHRQLAPPSCDDKTCRSKCSDCCPGFDCGTHESDCGSCSSDGVTGGCGGTRLLAPGGGGGGGGGKCYGEPSGGIHTCSVESAHDKCTDTRNVVCCCHSDTCPSACCETTNECGGDLDDALDCNGDIKNETVYNCIKKFIDECNIRGYAGDGQTYVDMVAKCAQLDSTTGDLYCPSGGATSPDFIPQEEICTATSPSACTNPWCNSSLSSSCFDEPNLCLCDEQAPCDCVDAKLCTVDQWNACP